MTDTEMSFPLKEDFGGQITECGFFYPMLRVEISDGLNGSVFLKPAHLTKANTIPVFKKCVIVEDS